MTYTIQYQGKWKGVNQFNSLHRFQQMKERNAITPIFLDLIRKAQISPLNQFKIQLRYRSRHDVDNVSGGGYRKIIQDLLKKEGLIQDDNPNFLVANETLYDKTLPNNTFIFTIIPID